jgi:hypothetical protein
MLSDQLSLVYIGYDKDKDIWPVTNSLFSLHWPHCSIPTFFVSINIPNNPSPFHPVLTFEKESISFRIQAALAQVKTSYVLILMGDFGLFSTPSEIELQSFVEFMASYNADYLQLGSHLVNHLSGKRMGNNQYRLIPSSRRYRLSLQPAIWSVPFLSSVVQNPINTSWDFEVFFMDNPVGKVCAQSAKAFFPKNYSFPIVNLLDKGKVSFPASCLLTDSKIPLPEERAVQKRYDYHKIRCKDYLYYHSPNWAISLLKKVTRHKGYSK